MGLRRTGLTAAQRMELKKAYRVLFRSGQNMRAALAEAQKEFDSPVVKTLLDFVAASKRGICADVGGDLAAGNGD